MQHSRTILWGIGVAAIAWLGTAIHAAPVTYEGTAIITTNTSAFQLSASDLGFPTGTNLQGQTVQFSITFDDQATSFGPDGIPADPKEGSYPYLGASSYTFQVDGGNLISNPLAVIEVCDDLGSEDVWLARSTFSPGGSRGTFVLEGPTTVFDDDSLRTVVDPADFTVRRALVLLLDLGDQGGMPGIDTDIEELRVTQIPLPAAGGVRARVAEYPAGQTKAALSIPTRFRWKPTHPQVPAGPFG